MQVAEQGYESAQGLADQFGERAQIKWNDPHFLHVIVQAPQLLPFDQIDVDIRAVHRLLPCDLERARPLSQLSVQLLPGPPFDSVELLREHEQWQGEEKWGADYEPDQRAPHRVQRPRGMLDADFVP